MARGTRRADSATASTGAFAYAVASALTPVTSADTVQSWAAAPGSIAWASTPTMRAVGVPMAVGSAMSAGVCRECAHVRVPGQGVEVDGEQTIGGLGLAIGLPFVVALLELQIVEADR